MRLAGTCLYVDDVPAVLEFYRRAFGFRTRFFDEAMQFAELDTGGAPGTPPVLAFASHQCGAVMMPGGYVRPAGGGPSSVEVAFYTADVPAAFAQAVGAGAVVIAGRRSCPGARRWLMSAASRGHSSAYALRWAVSARQRRTSRCSRRGRQHGVSRVEVSPAGPAAERGRSATERRPMGDA